MLIYLAIADNEAFFFVIITVTWGIFFFSVERTKPSVNEHLHCIVSNVPCKVRKYSGPPELLRSEISFFATFQSNGNSTENKELFE